MTAVGYTSGDDRKLNLSGGTMTGPLILSTGLTATGGRDLAGVGDGTTDDTAAINAQLAAAPAGSVIRGVPGKNYLHTGLVLRAGGQQTLDMTGCTVTLKSGSSTNDLMNSAASTVRRVLDAVTTASSTTITSATAAFVSGDVGKAITVQGAGAAGVPLTTTIASVTNGTTAVLTAAASTSVTGQYAAIGARDTNIRIIGGEWNHQDNTNGGSQWLAHGLRFRHVDGLTVRDVRYRSTAGKYAINPGDCTDVQISGVRIPTAVSDGVHVSGPCARVVIRDVVGDFTGDDLVSLTARDSTSAITDCAGDITDVLVDGAFLAAVNPSLFASVLKVVAGKTTDASANYTVRNLTARSLTGPTTTAAVVYVGDNSGGVVTDLDLDGAHSLGGLGFATVYLNNTTSTDRVTVSRVKSHPTDTYPVQMVALTAARVTVRDITSDITGSGGMVQVDSGCVIDSLLVDGVQANAAAGAKGIVVLANGAPVKPQVKRLVVSRVDFNATTGTNYLVGCQDTAATLTSVEISNINCANITYPLGMYGATTDVTANNVRATGMTSWIRAIGSTAAVTVNGATGLKGDNDTYTTDAGSTLTVAARKGTSLVPNGPGNDGHGLPGIFGPTWRGWVGGTATALVSGTVYAYRIVPNRDYTITLAAINVSTASGTDDPIEIAIFDGTGTTKLATTGSTTGKLNAGTGLKTVSLSITLLAGTPYIVAFEATSTASLRFAAMNSANTPEAFGSTVSTMLLLTKTGQSIPITAPMSSYSLVGSVPLIALRES